jgi:hypothetical protein
MNDEFTDLKVFWCEAEQRIGACRRETADRSQSSNKLLPPLKNITSIVPCHIIVFHAANIRLLNQYNQPVECLERTCVIYYSVNLQHGRV